MKWKNLGGAHTQNDPDGMERTYQKGNVFESNTDFSKRSDLADKFLRMPDDARVTRTGPPSQNPPKAAAKPVPVGNAPDPLDGMSNEDLRRTAIELDIPLQDGVQYDKQSLIDSIRSAQSA